MKKLLCLLLAALLLLTACQTEEEVTTPLENTPAEKTESTEEKDKVPAEVNDMELHWAEGFPLTDEELPWTVDTSSAAYLQELCDPKYEGRAAGSDCRGENRRRTARWNRDPQLHFGCDLRLQEGRGWALFFLLRGDELFRQSGLCGMRGSDR